MASSQEQPRPDNYANIGLLEFFGQGDGTNLVKDFVEKTYNISHFAQLAEYVKQRLEDGLKEWERQGKEIQAKVTYRAKDKKSLLEKLLVRNDTNSFPYKHFDDIWNDIHDLAGVRIILYTPSRGPDGQFERVKSMVKSTWGDDVKLKPHGDRSLASGQATLEQELATQQKEAETEKKRYVPRHLGYSADHYRIVMKPRESFQTKTQGEYVWQEHDKVEIQVMSALVHAWADAGHDVQYKSNAFGPTTEHEDRLLDAISGLVSTGDLLLEQFRQLVEKRTYAKIADSREFSVFFLGLDIFEEDHIRFGNLTTEGIDALFQFLVKKGLNYPLAVRTALKEMGYPYVSDLLPTISTFDLSPLPGDGYFIPLALMHHMLSKNGSHGGQYDHNVDIANVLPSYRMGVMTQALRLLQTFGGGTGRAREILLTPGLMDQQEVQSMDVLLAYRPHSVSIIDQDIDAVETQGDPKLEPIWQWFLKQAAIQQSLCGFLFKLAVLGIDCHVGRLSFSLTAVRVGESQHQENAKSGDQKEEDLLDLSQ